MKISPDELLAKLPLPADETWKDGVPFLPAFVRSGFVLEFFAPRGTDYQTTHDKDEFYIIASGAADLIKENETLNCKTGDAVFVAAGEKHHFENISDDFSTWVVFF